MANTSNSSEKWYFTKEQLENTPSRKCGYDAHKELSYRQQAANFIQDMGQRLKVSQLCINTAIVYMHRFYVFHSFTHFPWYQMAAAALFLAAKVEEQPRKLEYVIRVANACRNPRDTNIDINSEKYIAQSQDLVFNENVLLQTLGFDVAIDHPHTHVVRCCHLVRASKDLAQTSYFMASNSLHLTTMCIQYKPTVVACFCILVACKWSNWEIPLSNEKKEWFSYVDPTVTAELLQQLTVEFLAIFESCPSRLKEKIMAIAENVSHTPSVSTNSPFDTDPKKIIREDGKDQHRSHESKSGMENDPHRHRSRPHDASTSSQQQRERDRIKERMSTQQKPLVNNSQSKVPAHGSGHQRPPIDPKLKSQQPRPHSMGSHPGSGRTTVEPRDILREARDSPFGLANKEYSRGEQHAKDPQTMRADAINNKDLQQQKRGDYLLKSNVQPDGTTNYPDARMNYNAGAGDKQRIDPNKVRMDPNKMLSSNKHDPNARRHDEMKHYMKADADNIKKHLAAGIPDKNSSAAGGGYLNKPPISTSKKIKSPLNVDNAMMISKSVPKQNHNQHHNALTSNNNKLHHNDGGSNGSLFSPPSSSHINDLKHQSNKQHPAAISPKLETPTISPNIESMLSSSSKEEIPTPAVIKRPSLFSPEKTPPHKKQQVISKSSSPNAAKKLEALLPLSPLGSPSPAGGSSKRSRNYSSSSEPELRPVMKKIDQVEGFENIMRDSTIIGIHNMEQVSTDTDIVKTESIDVLQTNNKNSIINGRSSTSSLVNGLETNPTIISNLLKEAPTVPHLPAVAASLSESSSNLTTMAPTSAQMLTTDVKVEKEHHHHKSKKKNKEKHKHKDKNRDDKEKKKKHKDKDREKHKHKLDKHDTSSSVTSTGGGYPAEPIKLKIQKDKVQLIPESSTHNASAATTTTPSGGISQGLKIKIPKDKIKTDSLNELTTAHHQNQQAMLPPPPPTTGGIKLKIPKEKISNCNLPNLLENNSSSHSSGSRKRDRSSSGSSSSSSGSGDHHRHISPEAPHMKVPKMAASTNAAATAAANNKDGKQNGRYSYNSKVSSASSNSNVVKPQQNLVVAPPLHPSHSAPMYHQQPPPLPLHPHPQLHHQQQHPNPMYYYPQMPPPQLPNMSMPPPPPHQYMYPNYYAAQNFMYPQGMYHQQQQQQLPMPPHLSSTSGSNSSSCSNNTAPPLPMDAPPPNVPPPPPPE